MTTSSQMQTSLFLKKSASISMLFCSFIRLARSSFLSLFHGLQYVHRWHSHERTRQWLRKTCIQARKNVCFSFRYVPDYLQGCTRIPHCISYGQTSLQGTLPRIWPPPGGCGHPCSHRQSDGQNCVHSYVLDAWRKISQETNQFLVFLTFDVNIHCVHTALWFCFPFVKSFRTVIGKFFLFYKVQTNQYSKSSVDNTLFKEKEDCLLRTTCQFGDGCNNFAEKSSLNHK